MKYTQEIVIDLPVDRIVELFDDPENLKKWQPGLVDLQPLSGTPGEPGAKTRLKFQMGKRRVEMTETIEVKDLPAEFTATYEARGIFNRQRNSFRPEGPAQTRWISETEFQFDSWGMKVFSWLMPGSFQKQSYRYMRLFKEFAENQ